MKMGIWISITSLISNMVRNMNDAKQFDYIIKKCVNSGNLREYALENLKTATIRNLQKYGKDRNHNILYISGKSGSGKSTVALALKDRNTDVIHLDSYFELRNMKSLKNQNKRFNEFLVSHHFDPRALNDAALFKRDIKAYFRKVDQFTKLTEEFGKTSFDTNRRVIMEGVQLMDETMYPNKAFLSDKPTISLNTDADLSRKRANERDTHM